MDWKHEVERLGRERQEVLCRDRTAGAVTRGRHIVDVFRRDHGDPSLMEPWQAGGRIAVGSVLGVAAMSPVPPPPPGKEDESVAFANSHPLPFLGLFKLF